MTRPAGVTILGVLAIIGGVLALAFAFFFLFGSAYLVRLTGMPNYIASIMAMAVTLGLFVGGIDLVIGVGLLRLENWGRIATIVFTWLSLIFTGFAIVRGVILLRPFLLPRRIFVAAIDVLILWYLSRPHVKRAFLRQSNDQPLPPATPGAPSASA